MLTLCFDIMSISTINTLDLSFLVGMKTKWIEFFSVEEVVKVELMAARTDHLLQVPAGRVERRQGCTGHHLFLPPPRVAPITLTESETAGTLADARS